MAEKSEEIGSTRRLFSLFPEKNAVSVSTEYYEKPYFVLLIEKGKFDNANFVNFYAKMG
jgi:hypothetical protein